MCELHILSNIEYEQFYGGVDWLGVEMSKTEIVNLFKYIDTNQVRCEILRAQQISILTTQLSIPNFSL